MSAAAAASAAGLKCDGGSGAVSAGIWKWDNGSSAFPSVTLLWELLEGKGGGFQFNYGWHSKEGLVARPASQWAHARKPKAWPPELESRSQDSRRGAPVTRAEPQSEAVHPSRPFQSGLHLCSCHLSFSLADWKELSALMAVSL